MEYWNSTNLMNNSCVSRPDATFNFLYNYNFDHQFPGKEIRREFEFCKRKYTNNGPKLIVNANTEEPHHGLANLPPGMDSKMEVLSSYGNNMMNNNREKKNRLTNEQLELLERSFQEEIKLDPERKMKLSRELYLQPRQIAVWFQNRRARWKAKQLEQLYESLRRDFDVVSREKQLLQEEVMKLKAILRDRGTSKKQVLAELSPEETAESMPAAVCSSSGNPQIPNHFQTVQPNCVFNMGEYTSHPAASSYLAALPSYH